MRKYVNLQKMLKKAKNVIKIIYQYFIYLIKFYSLIGKKRNQNLEGIDRLNQSKTIREDLTFIKQKKLLQKVKENVIILIVKKYKERK